MTGPRKKQLTLAAKDSIAGYLFILPFIIGFISFMLFPMIQSIQMVFSEVNSGTDGFSLTFNGLYNLKRAFTIDPNFTRLLTEELGKMAIMAISVLVFSFFVALLLNQDFRGRGVVRAIFFLPVILSSGVLIGLETDNSLLGGMADYIKNQNATSAGVSEALQQILGDINFGSDLLDIVFQVIDGIYDVAIASGIQIIIFLSGLQTIPGSMYEAADIEGCTKWESFWKITLPMVSSLFMVNVIYTVVDYFLRTDNAVMEKIRNSTLKDFDYGFSSAMAWSYFAIVIAVLGVISLIFSRRVYYYE